MTFLCISCYFKGAEFLRASKAAGNTIYLLTMENLMDQPWPRESIDEFFFMEKDENTPENIGNIAEGMAWLMRERKVDRIVALDDFDVEKAAYLREEFRMTNWPCASRRATRVCPFLRSRRSSMMWN